MILSPHLDYATSPLLPAGHLVVSDTLTAPSTIVVYHLIIAAKNAGVPVRPFLEFTDRRSSGSISDKIRFHHYRPV